MGKSGTTPIKHQTRSYHQDTDNEGLMAWFKAIAQDPMAIVMLLLLGLVNLALLTPYLLKHVPSLLP